MSSGNASSDMAQKQVEFDLVGGKLVVKGVDASTFSVDCAQPRLNLKQLYNAVFSDIAETTEISVGATAAVEGDKIAKAHYASIKKIIDDAQSEINDKLPDVLDKRARIEESIADSMADAAPAGDATGPEDGGGSLSKPPSDEGDLASSENRT